MKKVKSYGRFYALMKHHPEADKDDIVMQFTDGRTTSLKDMSQKEFDEMCDVLERSVSDRPYKTQLKKLRSSVLLRIQRLGISTVDNWSGIDEFCMSPKIAGKRFAALNCDELKALIGKLEIILKKGGLKSLEEKQPIMLPIPKPQTKYLS